MNFEQIICFIADSPKQLFKSGHMIDYAGQYRFHHLSYTLSILEKEFMESLAAS